MNKLDNLMSNKNMTVLLNELKDNGEDITIPDDVTSQAQLKKFFKHKLIDAEFIYNQLFPCRSDEDLEKFLIYSDIVCTYKSILKVLNEV